MTASHRALTLTIPMLLGVAFVCFIQAKLSPKHKQQELITVGPTISEKPSSDSAAHHIEAQTLQQGVAQRRPNESDAAFLKRVLPVSYPYAYNGTLISHTWRPTPFGKHLFFSRTNGGENEYDLFLYILDPFQADTYAVQAFDMGNMGDLTTVAALFFVDVDQDGKKELLSLNECSLKETFKADDGELLHGHRNHYQTLVFQYVGLSSAGRPQYREDPTPRSYLDKLPTAAAVRQAIIKHQQKTAKRRLSAKPSK